MNFTMKQEVGKLVLKVDGFHFGDLVDCEVTWLFQSDDEELAACVNHRLEGDMSMKERLEVVKQVYTDFVDQLAALHKHESDCENAWLRAAEYDPEAVYEMEMQDNMFN